MTDDWKAELKAAKKARRAAAKIAKRAEQAERDRRILAASPPVEFAPPTGTIDLRSIANSEDAFRAEYRRDGRPWRR